MSLGEWPLCKLLIRKPFSEKSAEKQAIPAETDVQ